MGERVPRFGLPEVPSSSRTVLHIAFALKKNGAHGKHRPPTGPSVPRFNGPYYGVLG